MSDTHPLLLASLGAGNYGQAYYFLNGKKSKKTLLSFHALAEHLEIPFGQLRIFGTEPDPEKNLNRGSSWELIRDTFGRELEDHQKIVVPFGLDNEEHYQFFSLLIEVVGDAKELIVDMTHGFRSFSVILLMSLFFTEAIHKQPFKKLRIFYGAYEAGRDTEIKEVDFVEMDIVPELLNWTKAAERLIKYGLAGDLADQLKRNADVKQNWDRRFEELNLSLAYNAVHLIPEVAQKVQRGFEQNRNVLNEHSPISYLKPSIDQFVKTISKESVSERELELAQYYYRIGRYGESSIVLVEFAISRLTERLCTQQNSNDPVENQLTRQWPSKILGLLEQKGGADEKWRGKADNLYKKMNEWNSQKVKKLTENLHKLKTIRDTFAHGKQVSQEQLKQFHRNYKSILDNAKEWFDFSDAPVKEWVEFIKPFYTDNLI